MTRTSTRLFLIIVISISLFSALLPAQDVHALDAYHRTPLPDLDVFIEEVRDGQAGVLRGVYIPGILADPVVQQPDGMVGFVSPRQNVITEFSLASRSGSTGLLAHNDLAGEVFNLLQEGQEINLIDGSGLVSTFIVTEIRRYQALEPDSISSRFLDPESGMILTSTGLFRRVYGPPGRVVLQTCIEADGNPSWGRLFVIAVPLDE